MRPGDFVYAEQYDGFTLSTVLLTMGYLLVAAGLIASAVSLVLRLRRARDDERRQTAVDRVVGRVPGARRGGHPRGSAHPG